MNIFISADIEGMAGIVAWHQAEPAGRDYASGRQWMTDQVNAAVEGAIEGGATIVVVRDAHDCATNILLDKLDPRAELISGWAPLNSMVDGLDASFDAVMLLGYHARAMTAGGTLAHTWSSHLLELTLNGKPVGETGWAAAMAGHFGVPVAMVTGDDTLKAQLEDELPVGYHFVQTKTAMGYQAARLRPLSDVNEEIRETAAASIADPEALCVYRPDLPVTVTMRFRYCEGSDDVSMVPDVERIDATAFRFRAADMLQAHKCFLTLQRAVPRQP